LKKNRPPREISLAIAIFVDGRREYKKGGNGNLVEHG
jgi:hypothetical protein